MAETNTLMSGFLNPETGKVDYDAITRAVSEQAGRVGKVGGPTSMPGGIPKLPTAPLYRGYGSRLYKTPYGTGHTSMFQHYDVPLLAEDIGATEERRARAQKAELTGAGLRESYKAQRGAMEKKAAQGAEALELMGAQTVSMMKGLDVTEGKVQAQYDTAVGNWQKVVDQADDYAKAAPTRAMESLKKLQGINTSISEGRDFAMAHDAQATAQSVIAATRDTVRQAAETYGVDSPEYRQIQETRKQSLAAAQSGVIASYRKISEAQNTAFMNASAETMWRGDMYGSYQEQQHVETMRYMAQASQEYTMQASQFSLGVEQMRAAGLENLANWMVQTPAYAMDAAPFMTALAGLIPEESVS